MGWGTPRRTAPRLGEPASAGSAERDRALEVARWGERSRAEGDDRGDGAARRRARPVLSLKGRALKLLSQREHSRLELSRKLAPHAESPEQLESLLDELERGRFLSAQRFAESLAHRRAPRFGVRRIAQELGVHRLDESVSEPVLVSLRASERDRALDAWRRRFGEPAADAAARAKQHRFLAQRGFTGDAIRWVLRHGANADESAPDEVDDIDE
ncbi:MAG: recombination regulator RecX [Burkholderiales bacterium]|jgi:regulatory protein